MFTVSYLRGDVSVDAQFVKILKTVAELPDDFEIRLEQELKSDLEIDSLGLIDVVLNLEADFSADMDEVALAKVVTVGDLWAEVVRATAS